MTRTNREDEETIRPPAKTLEGLKTAGPGCVERERAQRDSSDTHPGPKAIPSNDHQVELDDAKKISDRCRRFVGEWDRCVSSVSAQSSDSLDTHNGPGCILSGRFVINTPPSQIMSSFVSML